MVCIRRRTKNIADGMRHAYNQIGLPEDNGKRPTPEVLDDDKLAGKDVLAFHIPRRPRTPTYCLVNSSAALGITTRDEMIVNNPVSDYDDLMNMSAFPGCSRTTSRILLFRKKLTRSDTKSGQSRLRFPLEGVKRLKIPLVTHRDTVLMKKKRGLPVILMGDRNRNRRYEVRLRHWGSSGARVLKERWMEFVRDNGLKKGDEVKLWGFRFLDTGRVCFLMACS